MLKSAITPESAKFHCRTCLIKLNVECDNTEVEGRDFINISKHIDLLQIIAINIGNSVEDDTIYPQNVCQDCFQKLEDFDKFCKQAKRGANALRSVLYDLDKLQSKGCDIDEYVQQLSTKRKRRKRSEDFLSDVLLETENVTFPNETAAALAEATLAEVEECDVFRPDPFDPFSEFKEEVNTDSDNYLKDDEEEDIFAADLDDELDHDYHPPEKKEAKEGEDMQSPKKKRGPKNVSGIVRKRVAVFRCEECKKRFVRKHHYDAHVLKEHEGSTRPYTCKECPKTYKTLSAVRYHNFVAHKPDSQTFPCEECGKEYKTPASLKSHRMALHLGVKRPKRYVCETCGAAFLNQKALGIHGKAKHSVNTTDGSTEYKCPECDKPFQSPYTLKYHVQRNHLQQKNCVCAVCGEGFAQRFMLVAHMRVHATDADKFPCDQCEKRFNSKILVTRHVEMVHLKIKPYICQFCGEAFGAPKTLRQHTFIHTGEKPFVCDVCGHSFRQQTAMKTHRNTHFKKLDASKITPIAAQAAGQGQDS